MANSICNAISSPDEIHAVRKSQRGAWQVSLIQAAMWRTCKSEGDARTIADGLNLAKAVQTGDAGGHEVARRLDATLPLVVQYLGEDWASNTIRKAAAQARKAT